MDQAIFRCVFLRTGLYRLHSGRWSLADPAELELQGLTTVWCRIREFFAEPGRDKSFHSFIDELRGAALRRSRRPSSATSHGWNQGVPTAIALRHRGHFVDDLLPSVIEDIAKNPDDYALTWSVLPRDRRNISRA